jgi:enoyl-CoA hydratase/carnithine racemase
MLGEPFDAELAAAIGLVTLVVPDEKLLATATETAAKLAAKQPGALQACKRLMKRFPREQIVEAMKAENEEFAARVRSPEAKQALTAFLNRRHPAFTKSKEAATAK